MVYVKKEGDIETIKIKGDRCYHYIGVKKGKEKAELIQEALDTLQAVTLSGRSVESYVAELFENIRNIEKENKKLKDEFMLRLAEAYLLPPTSNQMAEYKQWNYSKWYDEIKNQMRKEIKEGK